jgi:hypothetical protein
VINVDVIHIIALMDNRIYDLEREKSEMKAIHKQLKAEYKVMDYNKLQGRFIQKCNEVKELQKALEWASRIIGSGLDYRSNLNYDPMAWLQQYHLEWREGEPQ